MVKHVSSHKLADGTTVNVHLVPQAVAADATLKDRIRKAMANRTTVGQIVAAVPVNYAGKVLGIDSITAEGSPTNHWVGNMHTCMQERSATYP
jgi:hypothetical protein